MTRPQIGLRPAIEAAFQAITAEDLKPESLKNDDTRSLEVLFGAVVAALGRTHRPELLHDLESIFEESTRRGFLGSMDANMFSLYVQQRRWKEAR
jgi:hypothetical protein